MNDERKKYETPEIAVLEFEVKDIIVTSGGIDTTVMNQDGSQMHLFPRSTTIVEP